MVGTPCSDELKDRLSVTDCERYLLRIRSLMISLITVLTFEMVFTVSFFCEGTLGSNNTSKDSLVEIFIIAECNVVKIRNVKAIG